MSITFLCGGCNAKSVRSNIEEVREETEFVMVVTALCKHCGQLNLIDYFKKEPPKQVTDKLMQATYGKG